MKSRIQTILISMTTAIFMLAVFSFTQQSQVGNQETEGLNNLVPIGTVVAWSGNPAFLPDNWKVCDGTAYPKDRYGELYRVVANYWTNDEGLQKDLFNIPDLQGMFLRGVNGTRDDAYADPDIDIRKDFLGKNSKTVGSYQKDEFKQHVHKVYQSGNFGEGQSANSEHHMSGSWNARHQQAEGGKETRPKNVAVYWIIKVR
jgi:microcystin-dependent protein